MSGATNVKLCHLFRSQDTVTGHWPRVTGRVDGRCVVWAEGMLQSGTEHFVAQEATCIGNATLYAPFSHRCAA